MTSPLLLLAMLCCAVGCAAAGDKQFGCMHDQVAWNSSAMPARIVESENSRVKVKGATMSSSTAEWEPIRFTVFTADLQSESRYCTTPGQTRPTFIARSQTAFCKPEDILTNEKKNTLLNNIIPAALKLHSERLLVRRLTGNIIVPRYNTGPCGALTIPDSHFHKGVSNADMIMYVSAGPTDYPKSWAGTCSFDAVSNRPVVGAMNIGPAIIRTGDNSIRVVAHEIAHALGFNIQNMHSLKMVGKVQNIRGRNRLVVSSAVTLEKAKAHYNCQSIVGMELENEGDRGIVYSHWERRNAKDELMAGITEAGYYTALTLSAFESMGYYRANWGMEETMEWGRNKGCPFLEGKCVTNGKSNYPDMFCTDVSSTRVCTSDRRGLGMCSLGKARSPLPVEFQYFNDRTMGGASPFLDFCPVVVQHSITGCKDGNVDYMPGSIVGPNSLCLKGEGLHMNDLRADTVQDICAEILCETNTVKVRYAGNHDWHECLENSQIVPTGSFTGGKIVCPTYAEVCGNRKNGAVTTSKSTTDNTVNTVTTTTTTLKNEDMTSQRISTQHSGGGSSSTSTTLTMPEQTPGEDSTVHGAVRGDGATDGNLRGTTPAVSVQTPRASSTVPGALGKDGAKDGKLQSTTRPVGVEPIKKSSPEEADVKKSNGSLSASPIISGAKTVNLTKVKVDSSQLLSGWCGRFVPLCACLIYVFALCWAF